MTSPETRGSGHELSGARSRARLISGIRYEAGDGREDLQAAENIAQVLRGGAFNGNASYVRCAYRYRRHVRLSRIGFRVVVCP